MCGTTKPARFMCVPQLRQQPRAACDFIVIFSLVCRTRSDLPQCCSSALSDSLATCCYGASYFTLLMQVMCVFLDAVVQIQSRTSDTVAKSMFLSFSSELPMLLHTEVEENCVFLLFDIISFQNASPE